MSVIGVGTWQLGGEWGQRFTQHDVDQLLGRAGELGVNLVDTDECSATTRLFVEIWRDCGLAARAQLSDTQFTTGGCLRISLAKRSSRFSPSSSVTRC